MEAELAEPRAQGEEKYANPRRQATTEVAARRRRALRVLVFGALLEITLILPFVDQLAGAHPTIHFTQHGLIFLGGLLMGAALRDAYLFSRP